MWRPWEVPIANNEEYNVNNVPLVENNVNNVPLVENNVNNVPLVENNVNNVPLVENNVNNVPLVDNNVNNVPLVENNVCVIGRGNPIRSQTVRLVQNVNNWLKRRKLNGVGDSNVFEQTVQATGVSEAAVCRLVKCDVATYKTPSKKKINKLKVKFVQVDGFTRDLIRRKIYNCYQQKVYPTLSNLHRELKESTAGTASPFPYCETSLWKLLKDMGFRYKKTKRVSKLMESPRIVAWRHKYLRQIARLRSEGYNIVYLDETWYDTHTCQFKSWSDDSEECNIDIPNSKGERITILHCGGSTGFVNDALFTAHKKMAEAPADYHGTMTGAIFESWFKDSLLPNLPPKTAIVMDNASYHSRVINPRPRMYWKKCDILQFMETNSVIVPLPVPTKFELLDIIEDTLGPYTKKFAVDELATENGHIVVRLPPYHCCLNPIESVWSQLKRNVTSQNAKNQPVGTIINLIKQSCLNISNEQWKNYVWHVLGLENEYLAFETLYDNEVDPFIIHLGEDSETSDSDDTEYQS